MSNTLICPSCNSTNVETRTHVEEFGFKSHNVQYNVRASVPVRVCRSCGEEHEDEEGEYARHEATCHAMHRLPPREITKIRDTLGLTRRQFADLTGIGEASLARWELGELIQSESNDSLLRLVADPRIALRLAEVRRVVIPRSPLRYADPAITQSSVSAVRELDMEKYQGLQKSNQSKLQQGHARFSLSVRQLNS